MLFIKKSFHIYVDVFWHYEHLSFGNINDIILNCLEMICKLLRKSCHLNVAIKPNALLCFLICLQYFILAFWFIASIIPNTKFEEIIICNMERSLFGELS